ncbi:hypothetical protein JN00_0452 [Metamycoplasma subdolum]|uniref:Uncharacterized protein n=1 Tax=Metamycoplasma subdolum TaxID=92407 RepID=A0A3L9ZYH8_9BACT|nr:hypothetical protein [Metamycoplasma subdolum]RMA77500.1 hypothetical protein JN00_0452 [Metamycoplasma subdolum]WPB50692.1 hypothetical protein R9C05_00875 [Metamycoplasma subdolum]
MSKPKFKKLLVLLSLLPATVLPLTSISLKTDKKNNNYELRTTRAQTWQEQAYNSLLSNINSAWWLDQNLKASLLSDLKISDFNITEGTYLNNNALRAYMELFDKTNIDNKDLIIGEMFSFLVNKSLIFMHNPMTLGLKIKKDYSNLPHIGSDYKVFFSIVKQGGIAVGTVFQQFSRFEYLFQDNILSFTNKFKKVHDELKEIDFSYRNLTHDYKYIGSTLEQQRVCKKKVYEIYESLQTFKDYKDVSDALTEILNAKAKLYQKSLDWDVNFFKSKLRNIINSNNSYYYDINLDAILKNKLEELLIWKPDTNDINDFKTQFYSVYYNYFSNLINGKFISRFGYYITPNQRNKLWELPNQPKTLDEFILTKEFNTDLIKQWMILRIDTIFDTYVRINDKMRLIRGLENKYSKRIKSINYIEEADQNKKETYDRKIAEIKNITSIDVSELNHISEEIINAENNLTGTFKIWNFLCNLVPRVEWRKTDTVWQSVMKKEIGEFTGSTPQHWETFKWEDDQVHSKTRYIYNLITNDFKNEYIARRLVNLNNAQKDYYKGLVPNYEASNDKIGDNMMALNKVAIKPWAMQAKELDDYMKRLNDERNQYATVITTDNYLKADQDKKEAYDEAFANSTFIDFKWHSEVSNLRHALFLAKNALNGDANILKDQINASQWTTSSEKTSLIQKADKMTSATIAQTISEVTNDLKVMLQNHLQKLVNLNQAQNDQLKTETGKLTKITELFTQYDKGQTLDQTMKTLKELIVDLKPVFDKPNYKEAEQSKKQAFDNAYQALTFTDGKANDEVLTLIKNANDAKDNLDGLLRVQAEKDKLKLKLIIMPNLTKDKKITLKIKPIKQQVLLILQKLDKKF